MNTHPHNLNVRRRPPARRPLTTHHSSLTTRRSGGAVLIVVISLLAALAFLGFFFYSFSDQAKLASDNFINQPASELDADAVDDVALQQLIVSTPTQSRFSALQSGQVAGQPISSRSLLAATIGVMNARGQALDVNPHSGTGVTVSWIDGFGGNPPDGLQQPNEVLLDYNGDGTPDTNANNFIVNFSPFANNGAPFNFNSSEDTNGNGMLDPGEDLNGNGVLDPNKLYLLSTPDADYTYPDLNSFFLAYDAILPLDTNGDTFISPGEGRRVVIPSFCRPQLFPGLRTSTNAFGNLYRSNGTTRQVLRPHQNDSYFLNEDRNGNGSLDPGEDINNNGSLDSAVQVVRYLSLPTTAAQSGDLNRYIGPFPFSVSVNTTTPNEFGVFSALDTNMDGMPDTISNTYEYDADADGDGILDSIWLDLDHPIINLADGRQAVPMFYCKIIDADALANVNTHGDDPLYRFLESKLGANSANPTNFVYNESLWLDHSDMGLSPSEVNLGLVLSANPADAAYINPGQLSSALQQHHAYYQNSSLGFTRLQMANTELFWLLHGRPQFDSAGNPIGSGPLDVPGRFGEQAFTRGGYFGATLFPRAGQSGFDDDRDDNIGPFHPLDSRDGGFTEDANANGMLDPGEDFNGNGVIDPRLAGLVTIPSAVHPLDSVGMGLYLLDEDLNGNGILDGTEDVNGNNILDVGTRRLNGITNNAPISSNPSRWPQYLPTDLSRFTSSLPSPSPFTTPPQACFWQFQNGGYARAGNPVAGSPNGLPGYSLQASLATAVFFDGWLDEADELVVDSSYPYTVDAPFGPSELAGLHLSDSQYRQIHEDSRLRKLMPFNLEANSLAALIRSRLTTDSRDRLEHDYTVWGEDTNHNRMLDPGEDVNNNNILDGRLREFNDDVDGNGFFRFPPAFGSTTPTISSRHENTPPATNSTDPFRPVVRRLLTVENGNSTNIASQRSLPHQRLDVNRLLVNFDRRGNPIYRRLTPHPTFNPGANDATPYLTTGAGGTIRPMTHDNPSYPLSYYDGNVMPIDQLDPQIPGIGTFSTPVPYNVIATDKFAQEVWARYDRQRLARDIYVLLYTLCGPDTVDPTASAYPVTNDLNGNGVDDLVESMAQFAVNYVDALDQDDVITRFEYDANLSNGWNIDPNDSPRDTVQVVYGVEAQQLTLSEALWVRTTKAQSDLTQTIYPDDDREHQFLYVELRNASPFTVRLANDSWRLVRMETDGTTTATVTFRQNPGGLVKTVQPGANFLIATHDGSIIVKEAGSPSAGQVRSSDLYIDYNADSTYEAVAPDGPGTTSPATQPAPMPLCDLDLCYNDPTHTDYYQINTVTPLGNKPVGLLTSQSDPLAVDGTSEFILLLQRRRDLEANGVGQTTDSSLGPGTMPASDWITVDSMRVPVSAFNPTTNTDIPTKLQQNVLSVERRQPLTLFGQVNAGERTLVTATPAGQPWYPQPWLTHGQLHTAGSYTNHTLDVPGGVRTRNKNAANSQLTAPFSVWQPHFDRDFSSAYELLSVPVFPPDRLVEQLTDANSRLSGFRLVPNTAGGATSFAVRPANAVGYVLSPSGFIDKNRDGAPDDVDGNSSPDSWSPNRWHRLFEFIEVPPRSQDTIRDAVALRRRTNGRINLNTLRQEEVFAALIDDYYELNFNAYLNSPARITLDRSNGFNWFDELIIARDGFDPITGQTGLPLPLPGVPGASKPFRSPSYIAPTPTGTIDQTLQHSIFRNHDNFKAAGLNPLGIFEARTAVDADGNFGNGENNVDLHTRNRLLCKIANNTTNRSHVYMIWLGFELFEAHQPSPQAFPDVVQVGARITDVPGHREFVVVDMTRLEEAFNPVTGVFDFRKFIIYRKRIE